MTKSEALKFLQSHQPMPSDWEITDAEGDLYVEAIQYFITHPDPICIPLFLNSLSEDTGLGMYHVLDNVFRQFEPQQLTPHLINALQSEDKGVRGWAVDYALDFPASEMIEPLRAIVHSQEDEDSHYLAIATLGEIWKQTGDERALKIIKEGQQSGDREITELVEEILGEGGK